MAECGFCLMIPAGRAEVAVTRWSKTMEYEGVGDCCCCEIKKDCCVCWWWLAEEQAAAAVAVAVDCWTPPLGTKNTFRWRTEESKRTTPKVHKRISFQFSVFFFSSFTWYFLSNNFLGFFLAPSPRACINIGLTTYHYAHRYTLCRCIVTNYH